jgi:phosphatidylserine/phosphatidylglycerophosphate/cardiolipin synthase-like enzyme
VALSVVVLPVVLNPPRHSHKADVTTVRRDPPCGPPEIHLTDFEAVDAGLIAKANRTILMAAHSLTDRATIDALVAAQNRGVDVKLVLDPTQQHGDLGRLRSVGNWLSGSQMHLELIVIDGIIVRTGSANFSQNGQAQPSDVVVEFCPTIAEKYASLFDELFEASC